MFTARRRSSRFPNCSREGYLCSWIFHKPFKLSGWLGFSPPYLCQPTWTSSISASNLTSSASWMSNLSFMRKLRTDAGRLIVPQSAAPIVSHSCRCLNRDGKSAGFDRDGTLSIQAENGAWVSTMEAVAIKRNIARDGLLRFIKLSLHASLSMKHNPHLAAQEALKNQRVQTKAYISTSQMTCSPTFLSQCSMRTSGT